MRFGKTYNKSNETNAGSGGGRKWIRNFKEGDTRIRLLQEPEDWKEYYEHFNPGGYSFPCTNEKLTCPGCSSENEKMQSASKKIAINCLVNGYVDVYKFSRKLADKLDNRYQRIGTVMDRDYVIIRTGTQLDTDWDVEGEDKAPLTAEEKAKPLNDVEAMLLESFEQSWPDFDGKPAKKEQTQEEFDKLFSEAKKKASKKKEEKPGKEYTQEELREKTPEELKVIWQEESGEVLSLDLFNTTDSIVDYMVKQLANA